MSRNKRYINTPVDVLDPFALKPKVNAEDFTQEDDERRFLNIGNLHDVSDLSCLAINLHEPCRRQRHVSNIFNIMPAIGERLPIIITATRWNNVTSTWDLFFNCPKGEHDKDKCKRCKKECSLDYICSQANYYINELRAKGLAADPMEKFLHNLETQKVNYLLTSKKATFCTQPFCAHHNKPFAVGPNTQLVECPDPRCAMDLHSHTFWCIHCRTPHLIRDGCDVNAINRELDKDPTAMALIRDTCTQCPGCKMWQGKDEACDKVKCSNCSVNFCFDCGEDITHLGRNYLDHLAVDLDGRWACKKKVQNDAH